MKFCVNVGVAGALVMYDRLLSLGRFADRPVHEGGPEDFSPEKMREQRMAVHLARQKKPK
jgi:hypothetical protein